MLPIDKLITPLPLLQISEVAVATLLLCFLARKDLKLFRQGNEAASLQAPAPGSDCSRQFAKSGGPCCSLILGAWRGSTAIFCYLLLGLTGLLVFAQGSSGFDKLWAASSGFLVSFPFVGFWLGLKVIALKSGNTKCYAQFDARAALTRAMVIPKYIGFLVIANGPPVCSGNFDFGPPIMGVPVC